MNKKWFLLLLLIAFVIYWMVWPVENCQATGASQVTPGSGGGSGCDLGPVQWQLGGSTNM